MVFEDDNITNVAKITNPKRNLNLKGVETWYPYYAGFSSDFVSNILCSLNPNSDKLVLDPWNGSGTTTYVAGKMGNPSIGFDLNPVMVIAGKAINLNASEFTSILPLTHDIIKKSKRRKSAPKVFEDPLTTWFLPQSAYHFRLIEMSIQKLLVSTKTYSYLKDTVELSDISCLASFFYVALFKTIRKFVAAFYASNPTWIKIPEKSNRLNPSDKSILGEFLDQISEMLMASGQLYDNPKAPPSLRIASSSAIPLESDVVDYVITSPPYCTRIDYAIATLPELTLLGYSIDDDFRDFRTSLIGTSTVRKKQPKLNSEWGFTCNKFLNQILHHNSKASSSYYYKNHLQYFESIYSSVREIERVLKPGGICSIVVQDSYYKDIHNDLPNIFIEMFNVHGLELIDRADFISERNMARINPYNKKYRLSKKPIESVLILKKNSSFYGAATRSSD